MSVDATASVRDPGNTARLVLRGEGAVALTLAIAAYYALGYSWWLFAATLLVPDLAMVGYIQGPRIGAAVYNLAHTYIAPFLLAVVGYLSGAPLLLALAAIWAAHIGLDRILGYGLKYPTAFQHTHLTPPA